MSRRHLLASVLALALLPGCGGSPESGGVVQPETGGGLMAANDTAVVANALRAIETACRTHAPQGAYTAPARAVARMARTQPHGVYDSGNAEQDLQMTDVARQLAAQLRGCGAPGAAALLAGQPG